MFFSVCCYFSSGCYIRRMVLLGRMLASRTDAGSSAACCFSAGCYCSARWYFSDGCCVTAGCYFSVGRYTRHDGTSPTDATSRHDGIFGQMIASRQAVFFLFFFLLHDTSRPIFALHCHLGHTFKSRFLKALDAKLGIYANPQINTDFGRRARSVLNQFLPFLFCLFVSWAQ